WVLWPEPDLPRTSTGKVRRKDVEAWLAGIRAAASGAAPAGAGSFGAADDWLLRLIAQITGEKPPGVGDELRLDEDLLLDSLGRVQLAASLEERLGIGTGGGLLDNVRTLGELRALIGGADQGAHTPAEDTTARQASVARTEAEGTIGEPGDEERAGSAAAAGAEEATDRHVYPHWPWWRPVAWLRTAFIEAVERPLVWLLAAPRVETAGVPADAGPLLIVANHVSAYDGPLIQFALPGPVRRRMAAAMAGDMLADFRRFRDPDRKPGQRGLMLTGPLVWLLLTALFNVFPLPRRRDFQRAFRHAGEAMDRGFHVLVFPEGTRSAEGQLARFRGGIGLLVKQSGARVLPVGLAGMGEIKTGKRRWFRPGTIVVRVGPVLRFAPEETEAEITEKLHAEVERLMTAASGQ
ncbi:MAG: lysophospholipid acyltransferase family protein, partial [Terracidiphilus sp.]